MNLQSKQKKAQPGTVVTLFVKEGPGTSFELAIPKGSEYWRSRIEKTKHHSDEPEIWYALEHFADTETLFIDGGANIGLWSSAASKIIDEPSQIIAVEPGSDIMPVLEHNHNLNDNSFTIINKALWGKANEVLVFDEYTDEGMIAHVDRTVDWHQNLGKEPTKRNITTTTIDEITKDALKNQTTVNKIIVKLDIENSEVQAIEGAQETLAGQNTLIIYEDNRILNPDSAPTRHILERDIMCITWIAIIMFAKSLTLMN